MMIFSTAEPDQYGKRFLSFLNEEAIEWIFSFKKWFSWETSFSTSLDNSMEDIGASPDYYVELGLESG